MPVAAVPAVFVRTESRVLAPEFLDLARLEGVKTARCAMEKSFFHG